MVMGNHSETFAVVAIGVVVASVVVAVVVALACIDGVVVAAVGVVASTPFVDVAVQYNVGLGMEMTLMVLLVL